LMSHQVLKKEIWSQKRRVKGKTRVSGSRHLSLSSDGIRCKKLGSEKDYKRGNFAKVRGIIHPAPIRVETNAGHSMKKDRDAVKEAR